MACTDRICDVGQKGTFLPAFGDDEQTWDNGLRCVLYAVGLLWMFAGVAIASDVFMGAIETITSKKTSKLNPETGSVQTVFVWNATVANLTLMALGSSAPEILLSVIELLTGDMYSGDLGPSTIVGSAAFNMLCISAVCVSAIPEGDLRKIEDVSVFAVTATFSVFAYLWLLIVVSGTSVDEVSIMEGVATFVFFPILVVVAFCADKGYIKRLLPHWPEGSGGRRRKVKASELTKEEMAQLELEVRRLHKGVDLTAEQLARIINRQQQNIKSRAAYRMEATRSMLSGSRKRDAATEEDCCQVRSLASVVPISAPSTDPPALSNTVTVSEGNLEREVATVEFKAGAYTVLESVSKLNIEVIRSGCLDKELKVNWKTRDGTAVAGQDYKAVENGLLIFAPCESCKHIVVEILDDTACESDEDFFVDLFDPSVAWQAWSETDTPETCSSCLAELGFNSSCQISIIDDDDKVGELLFQEDRRYVKEQSEDLPLKVTVQRKNGTHGKVSCRYYTEQDTAIQGMDYYHVEGELEFEDNQASADIELTIKPRGRYEREECFRLYLTEPKGGITFDPNTDGGDKQNILTVIIQPDEAMRNRIDNIIGLVNMDQASEGNATYKDQFLDALYPNGAEEDASVCDWMLHIVLLPWKLFFAFIPPSAYCGGWLCFCISLVFIGIVTALIGDLAALLGCVLSIPDAITAITFVALGTSLPDTFASKSAAVQDDHADASIGNVTGSNSVNVFLGLGMPWTIGAIYWRIRGRTEEWKAKYSGQEDFALWNSGNGKFIVIGGDLGFSVTVFSACAICCLAILVIRRRFLGGELGGPKKIQYVTSMVMVSLWLLYVGLSSWKTMQSYSC